MCCKQYNKFYLCDVHMYDVYIMYMIAHVHMYLAHIHACTCIYRVYANKM